MSSLPLDELSAEQVRFLEGRERFLADLDKRIREIVREEIAQILTPTQMGQSGWSESVVVNLTSAVLTAMNDSLTQEEGEGQ